MARHMRANATEDVDILDTTTTGTIGLGEGLTSGDINIGNSSGGDVTISGLNYINYHVWTPDFRVNDVSVPNQVNVAYYQVDDGICQFYAKISYSGYTSPGTGEVEGHDIPWPSVTNGHYTGTFAIHEATCLKHTQTDNFAIHCTIGPNKEFIKLRVQREGSTYGATGAVLADSLETSGSLTIMGEYFVDQSLVV